MEIVKRLIQIQSEVGPIAKSRKASTGGGGSYAFRGIDDIYQALHSLMDKHEVINIIEVQNFERSERDRIDKQTGQVVGVMIHVILKVKYTFITTDGSKIEAVSIGEGADTGDKATNKALSAAHKYALLQCFMIPTEEQKDSEYDNKDLPAKPAPATAVTPPPPKPAAKSADTPMMQKLKEAEAKIARGEKLDVPPMNIPNVAESKLGTYVIKFGKKYNGKALNSIVIEDLIDYVDYLTTTAKNKKEPLSGPALEFVNKANEYLNHQEQKEISEPDFQDDTPWPNEPPPNLGDDDPLPF